MKRQEKRERLNEREFQEIINAVEVLKKGGIILYPTDTIWGLGCDASNAHAVDKLYELKKRDSNKPMLALLDNDNKLQRYVKDVPEVAWELIDAAVHPLTIVYSGVYNIAENLYADDGSLGIRIVDDLFCTKLIQKLNRPLVSTSANFAGEDSPRSFRDISDKVKSSVDYVVDYNQNKLSSRKESSIFQIKNNGEFKIIRK